MTFRIIDFWKPLLSAPARGANGTLAGWAHVESGLPTFLEAPLRLASGFGDANPEESSVILVSAPGAVGKSTLARQISLKTGAMLLDLAEADPVGANTLVGGLARTNLYQQFQEGNASLVIDGLDEARMRVTQGGFVAFMNDVMDLAKPKSSRPIVLFGRTGAVEDAWLWLSVERDIEAPVLEIGYFDRRQSAEFAKTQAQNIRKESRRREPDGRAIDLLLEQLKTVLQIGQDSFSGYAPVLIALAKRVSDPSNPDTVNTQALIARLENGQEQVTLTGIADSILSREQEKLSSLSFQDKMLKEKLYTPEEQIARLVQRIYGDVSLPSLPTGMSAQDRQIYNEALDTWVSEHPFLDGTGTHPSSVVFGGLLASKALHMESVSEKVLRMEFDDDMPVNPFLAEFYISDLEQLGSSREIRADHVGVLYASLRARLAQGEIASLRIDGETDEDDDHNEVAEVEITRKRQSGEDFSPLCFVTDPAGHFRFGSQVEDIDITAPGSQVSAGWGIEVVFVAPISIDAETINLNAGNVVVSPSSCRNNIESKENQIVSLQASNLRTPYNVRPPILRGGVGLEVWGVEFEVYPWREFAADPPKISDRELEEPLRRLKKILKLFRSRGNDQLAKYRDAIEHRRRTRGSGQRVLDRLLTEKVLRREGQMYYLDPNRLWEVVGLHFRDLQSAHAILTTTPRTIEFLKRVLD